MAHQQQIIVKIMVSASLLSALALAASTAAPGANAFATSSAGHRGVGLGPLYASDDASAQALSDYMAKSHEEKLRAVKDVEGKKNAEIEALKAEIQQIKSSSALATTAAPAPLLATVDPSEMESKLASYQSFMAEYIVNAQNQKLLAVKEAELKAETKFQERLEKLFEASGIALPDTAPAAAVAPASAAAVETTSFQKRNAEIIAAAAAGKSRWGSMEIERAVGQAKNAPVAAAAAAAPPKAAASAFEQRNAQVVAAASAGKSRWGDKEVARAKQEGAVAAPAAAAPVVVAKAPATLTLEDRLAMAVEAVAAPAAVATVATPFQQRNAEIVAAAAAGKSRWGSMEIERAAGQAKSAPAPAAAASASVFDQRNAQVVAAAGAGKSRWGDKEVARAKNAPAASAVMEKAPAAVTLDDRVNLGARMLGA